MSSFRSRRSTYKAKLIGKTAGKHLHSLVDSKIYFPNSTLFYSVTGGGHVKYQKSSQACRLYVKQYHLIQTLCGGTGIVGITMMWKLNSHIVRNIRYL